MKTKQIRYFFFFGLLFIHYFLFSQREWIRVEVNDSVLYQQYFYDKDLLTPEFFRNNREELRKKMPEKSVAVIFSAPEKVKSKDVYYEYHQSPDFYYLTGLRESDAMLLIFKSPIEIKGKWVNELIFVRDKDPRHEMWTGKRIGPAGVERFLGISMALSNKEFPDFEEIRFDQFKRIYYIDPGQAIENDPFVKGDLYDLKNHFLIKTEHCHANLDNSKLSTWLAEMREVKKKEELLLLQKAIDITCDAHIELMKKIQPGMKEYQSEAVVEYVFKYSGAEEPGFPSIIGSGENSCILHYNTNRKTIFENELLVVDIGAEYRGYTADVTRTLPVSGKFSEAQLAIYNLVLKAQQAAIEKCIAGNRFWDPHNEAMRVITQGLLELGIINKSEQAQWYFPHGTSHYLGLDVHDAGNYGPLKPGNVITVEPGIYIPAGSPCDKKWWNIGVRIEDDILITEGDPVILSEKAPRDPLVIEQIIRENRNR